MQQNQPWYAVRCLFHDKKESTYEERTILIRADSQEEAVKLAEKDAASYEEAVGVKYLRYLDTFHLFDENLESGTEIFSLMRTAGISSDEYIDRYLDSGTERRSK